MHLQFQHHSREAAKINHVPVILVNEILEENVCKALPLIGVIVTPENLP